MKLKTFILTLLAFGFSIMAGAQQDKHNTTDKVVVKASMNKNLVLNGTDETTFFTVQLEGTENYYNGYQMNIHIPDGMTVVFNNSNKPKVNMGTSSSTEHSFYPAETDEEEDENGDSKTVYKYPHQISSQLNGSVLTVVCVSTTSLENFKQKSGDLFRVYVKASPYMKPGDIDITIDNVVLNHNVWNEEKEMYDAVSYYPSEPCGGTIEGVSGVCNNVPFNVSSAAKWSTCILPFDAEIPDGVTAYTSDDNEDSRVYLRKATSIEAYTPYVLKSEAGYSGTLSGTVNAANYPDGGFVTKGNLNGAIVPQNVTAGYVLQNLSGGVKFYAIGNGSTFNIPAGKCWMTLPAGASAKELNMVIVDEETGIDNVIASPFASDDAIYNLHGMKISKPAAGKLYIKNGKKYAINR